MNNKNSYTTFNHSLTWEPLVKYVVNKFVRCINKV